jgi:hypothetical protein
VPGNADVLPIEQVGHAAGPAWRRSRGCAARQDEKT